MLAVYATYKHTFMTMPKSLPDTVTNLDILKTVAVIFMIIDHIGLYLLQDALWFRALGRIGGAPIWAFLIGYALTREIPTRLMLGALILVASDLFLKGNPFALNILVSFILIRLSIDHIMPFLLQSRYVFAFMTLLMTICFMGTNLIFDYGTLTLMFAMFGYLTRHKIRLINETFLTRYDYYGFAVFTGLAYIILQNAVFGFSESQSAVMAALMLLVIMIQVTIHPATYPHIRGTAKNILQFCGRKTLEIYVAHLLLFKIVLFIILTLN